MIAQHDGMPRNWSYPTSLWGRREGYIERITLDGPGSERGPFRLAVGVYSAEAGRLADRRHTTAGIDPGVQQLSKRLGIELDPDRNDQTAADALRISTDASPIEVWVIHVSRFGAVPGLRCLGQTYCQFLSHW